MKTVKQLALFLENKPGALAKLCQALGKEDINIHALSVSDAVDHSVVRLVVDKPTKALHLLGHHGVLVVERSVLMLTGQNKIGEMAEIAQQMGPKAASGDLPICASQKGDHNNGQ